MSLSLTSPRCTKVLPFEDSDDDDDDDASSDDNGKNIYDTQRP